MYVLIEGRMFEELLSFVEVIVGQTLNLYQRKLILIGLQTKLQVNYLWNGILG